MKKADPFFKTKLTSLRKQMENWTKENNHPTLLHESQSFKDRKKLVVTKTFYTCGIVVPFNKKTKVGYREIPETDSRFQAFHSPYLNLHKCYVFIYRQPQENFEKDFRKSK